MAARTEGYTPFVCGEKTIYNPIPAQAAASKENTHSTGPLRAVSAYTLRLVQSWFKYGDRGIK